MHNAIKLISWKSETDDKLWMDIWKDNIYTRTQTSPKSNLLHNFPSISRNKISVHDGNSQYSAFQLWWSVDSAKFGMFNFWCIYVIVKLVVYMRYKFRQLISTEENWTVILKTGKVSCKYQIRIFSVHKHWSLQSPNVQISSSLPDKCWIR